MGLLQGFDVNEPPPPVLVGSRAAAMNDYFADSESPGHLLDRSIFADTQPFDPIETYLEMRNEPVLSFEHPSPLAKLEARAISGLIYLAAKSRDPTIFDKLRADIAPLNDPRKTLAALLTLIRLRLESLPHIVGDEQIMHNVATIARLDLSSEELRREIDRLDVSACQRLWHFIAASKLKKLPLNDAFYIALWNKANFRLDATAQGRTSFVPNFHALMQLVDHSPPSIVFHDLVTTWKDRLQQTFLSEMDRIGIELTEYAPGDIKLQHKQREIVELYRALTLAYINTSQWDSALDVLASLHETASGWHVAIATDISLQSRVLSSILGANAIDLLESITLYFAAPIMKQQLLDSARLRSLLQNYMAMIFGGLCESNIGRYHVLTILEAHAPNLGLKGLGEICDIFGVPILLQIVRFTQLFSTHKKDERDRPGRLPHFSPSALSKFSRRLMRFLVDSPQLDATKSPDPKQALEYQSRLLAVMACQDIPDSLKDDVVSYYNKVKRQHREKGQSLALTPRTMVHLSRAVVSPEFGVASPDALAEDYLESRAKEGFARLAPNSLVKVELSHADLTTLVAAGKKLESQEYAGELYRHMLHQNIIPDDYDVNMILMILAKHDLRVALHTLEAIILAGFRPNAVLVRQLCAEADLSDLSDWLTTWMPDYRNSEDCITISTPFIKRCLHTEYFWPLVERWRDPPPYLVDATVSWMVVKADWSMLVGFFKLGLKHGWLEDMRATLALQAIRQAFDDSYYRERVQLIESVDTIAALLADAGRVASSTRWTDAATSLTGAIPARPPSTFKQ